MDVIFSREETGLWFSDLQSIAFNMGDKEVGVKEIELASGVAKKYIPNINDVQNELGCGKGYVLFRGCPIEFGEFSFPADIDPDMDTTLVSALALLGVTMAMGFNPFSFLQEKDGALVHQIFPNYDLRNEVSSNGYVEFKPHVDGAYLNRSLRPETLSLICMNNDARTSTAITLVDDVLNMLEGEDIAILLSSEFIHVSPATFRLKGGVDKVKSSVLDKIDGVWEVKVAAHSTESCTLRSKRALEKFMMASDVLKTPIHWSPGDFVIFNNFRCLHSRGEVQGARWLKRCYGSRMLSPGTVIDLQIA